MSLKSVNKILPEPLTLSLEQLIDCSRLAQGGGQNPPTDTTRVLPGRPSLTASAEAQLIEREVRVLA